MGSGSRPSASSDITHFLGALTRRSLAAQVPRLKSWKPAENSLYYTIFSGLTASLCGSLCVVLLKVQTAAPAVIRREGRPLAPPSAPLGRPPAGTTSTRTLSARFHPSHTPLRRRPRHR